MSPDHIVLDAESPRWSLSPLVSRGTRAWNQIIHELRVTYGIVWRDLTVTVVPGGLMCLTALHSAQVLSFGSASLALARSFAYFLLHVYVFTIDNQILGCEEDRANKPDRVLPLGLISLHGARVRRMVAMLLFPGMGLLIGGLPFLGWSLAWIALTLCYNHLGMHRHWITKNLVFISLYAVLLLAPAWQIAAPLDAIAWRWILVVSVAMGITLNLQDLRDVVGDVALGRRTLPIVLGQDAARWCIAVSIALLPIGLHFGLVYPNAPTLPVVAAELALGALNLLVAARTLRLRTRRADHATYMLHTYWFCLTLASGLVLI